MIQVTVNSLSGQLCNFRLHLPCRISSVKEQILKLAGIPCEVQRLFRGTTELRADQNMPEDGFEVDVTLVQRPPEQAHWLRKVEEAPSELRNAPDNMKADIEIVLAAVTQQGRMIQYASEELQDSAEVISAALEQEGSALEFAGAAHRSNRSIVLQAVKQNGLALRYASGGLSSDHEIVAAAINENGSALQFAGDQLRSDLRIVLAAVQRCGCAWQWAQGDAREDRGIVLAAVASDASVISLLPQNYGMDLEVMLTALKVSEDLVRRCLLSQQTLDLETLTTIDEAISNVEGEVAAANRKFRVARVVHPWARHVLQRQNLRMRAQVRAQQKVLLAQRALNALLTRKAGMVKRAAKLKKRMEAARQKQLEGRPNAGRPSSN
mmetsp:Transcript_101310/g.180062  ORF Transcript_101310/g.180062 Transcript_101310/m.180062 type:complete len:380 (-) Transcript_101310:185-1324(-)